MKPYSVLLMLLIAALLVGCSSKELSKQDAQNLSAKTDELKAALENAQAQASDALASAQEKSDQLQTCMQQVGKQDNQTKTLIKSLGDDLAAAHADLKACQAQVGELETDKTVISDAARRLCCMKRIDDPSIDSFSVEGGKIVCKAGGTTSVSC